ncbi:hypothetical protein B7P43_G10786 [Cryptotermes secundus]|uniref:Uncharacterized protein n=2 Tax=Cryptotermes secundus TaxID=105785 RepID=A0A2J7QKT7_9NEOP|nr:hypothetical protein B7P43_G10786 [Cryptotermes secundus]
MACKIHDFYLMLFLMAVLYTSACAEEGTEDETVSVDRNSLSSIRLPNDMSLPANMLQLVTAAGALVLGFIGVAVVLSLILPLFGVRFCNLVGTCEHFTTTAYSGTGMGHNYDAYSTAGTYNQPSLSYATNNFQKRSLEYVGPILKALSAAYDKYAVPLIKKKE